VKSTNNYILWMPSWYPNKLEHANGDFIQRHATATAEYCPITLIHFTQFGYKTTYYKNEVIINERGNLKEIIIYISFNPTGINIIDKILYNYKFYNNAKKFIKEYFLKFGYPELIHVHVPMKSGILALWVKRKYKINYIVSEQSSHYLTSSPDSYFKKNLIFKKQVESIFKNAKIVTNVSSSIGKVISDLFKLKEFRTINNVVNTNFFNYSDEKNDVFTYIHVSSLSDQKNIFGILKVFKTLKNQKFDCKLQLIGPYNNRIKDFIVNNDLIDQIELMGEIPYEKVADYLKKAHCFVLFSIHENFPCVVVEALCCGLPVVSSDVAGIKEAVTTKNGILVSSENEEELLRAIVKVRNEYTCYDCINISKEAQSKYNYNVIGNQFFNLYSSILYKKG
jgi:glycosyltransferase involved in cell wall biosynthesis